MFTYLTVLGISCVAGVVLTALARAIAPRLGLLDIPDPTRKLHAKAIPLGGGIAILAATFVGAGMVLLLPGEESVALRSALPEMRGFAIAALLICVLGLADDREMLRGRQKLVGQIAIIGVLLYFGLTIQRIVIFDWHIELGLLAAPFTLCWMLGAINSLNLLDGADGFAATVGIIISGAIAIMAAAAGHPAEAAIAVAITGALLGFLVFNFPPASIFLGDAGSMVIGLTVGVLAIRGTLKGPATVALAAPLAVLAIPFFDSTVAILRRWLTGRSLYTTDRGHLHHHLTRNGLGPRTLVLVVGILCAATAAGALVGVYMNNEPLAFVCVAAVLGILVVSRVFGFSELVLLTSRALAFGNSLVSAGSNKQGIIREETFRLQGSRNWDEIWNTLTDFAERHNLNHVQLDLNAAWIHEGFHANWHRNESVDEVDFWSSSVPLVVGNRSIGTLQLTGPANNGETSQLLVLVAEMIDALQPAIRALADELPADQSPEVPEPKLTPAEIAERSLAEEVFAPTPLK